MQYLLDFAQKQGWKTEQLPHAVAGDVGVITLNAEATGAPIALSGHLDTVHAIGSFGTPPVHIDEEKLYGPGAAKRGTPPNAAPKVPMPSQKQPIKF